LSISPTCDEHYLCNFPFSKKIQSQTLIGEKLRKVLAYEKAACKMLVKLKSSQFKALTFCEQLLRQFLFAKKIQSQIIIGEKVRKTLLHQKAAHKM
jgi:hypothetical protein